jgi:hypothetical protein
LRLSMDEMKSRFHSASKATRIKSAVGLSMAGISQMSARGQG